MSTTKSRVNCCVPQCSTIRKKDRDLSFHRFPNEMKKKKAWIHVLRIGKDVSKWMTVCSKHFVRSDFLFTDSSTKRRRLKQNAVPSVCLPKLSVEVQTPENSMEYKQRNERYAKITRKRNAVSKEMESEPCRPAACSSWSSQDDRIENAHRSVTEPESSAQPLRDPGAIEEAELLLFFSNSCPGPKTSDKGTQVQFDIGPRLNTSNLSDLELNRLTGIHSVSLLNKLVSIIIREERPSKRLLTIREQVIMTMMRLKLDVSFVVLGTMFTMTSTTCKNIFVEILSCLARVLQTAIQWPSKEEIEGNIPLCFSELDGVRVVVDCTEIPVCCPKCLKCNVMLYSNYKKKHTLKYMVSVSPGGIVTNISLGYGGRASDSIIFEQSQLPHMLEPYQDKVLVDKGFLIDDICAKSFVEVKRPPFVRDGKLTEKEAKMTRSIARARIHVERAIQRLKLFHVLHGTVPWDLVKYFDYIMIVICGIVNLGPPILADNKF